MSHEPSSATPHEENLKAYRSELAERIQNSLPGVVPSQSEHRIPLKKVEWDHIIIALVEARRSESARPEFEVQLPDGDNRPIKVWFMERQPNGKWRISITVDETPRSATAESDPVKALAANLTETDAARWRFVARMWPIDLLMLLNSHMDGLDDMLVGEAVDKAIAADIPRHK